MPRSRVLSFMSQWGAPPRSPTLDSHKPDSPTGSHFPKKPAVDTSARNNVSAQSLGQSSRDSPSPTTQQRFRSESRSESRTSRPMSMMQTYQPPVMDVAQDTLPELQPIFTFLNSHSNKLYQEGYFLKLHDLDSRGRPSADRAWNECFAQLVGTVLSLWDAAALDAAGEDGEVVPTFINLSDASIKMIESLPMNGSAGGSLQNVLSVSTAANNRYLLHFNSLNSLTQWTAGIRLAIYEHATLQESYTGSLIAGKGKLLNNIRTVMERSKFKTEDWARVRFGAGTPWRRCWCVVNPPDEKEFHKAQKTLKKRGTYDRTIHVPKGDVRFYDTRKVTKKTRPIATITDAYAAYAIYPQSKPLIDQSTLVKIEGSITIHASPETTTEGFVFVMPEVHPAVTGFEMMLRFLFPVFDTFALYGRPDRLIADTLDQRGLMFAMPKDRRYGYLDILDISGLIHTEGSQNWNERQWRNEMKKLTSHRMNSGEIRGSPRRSTLVSRTSLNLGRTGVRFSEDGSTHSSPATRKGSPAPADDSLQFAPPRRSGTTPLNNVSPGRGHNRSASEAIGYKRYQTENPSRLSYEANNAVDEYEQYPPAPPVHGGALREKKSAAALERVVSESEELYDDPAPTFEELTLQSASPQLVPVSSPPGFLHTPGSKPARVAIPPAELRRANSAMDAATLHQLADATGKTPQYERDQENYRGETREVASVANRHPRMPADAFVRNEGMVNRHAGYSGHKPRLSTVPGSPYVPDTNAPSPYEDMPPPVPTHQSNQIYNRSVEMSPTLGTSRSINRKPVPIQTALPVSPLDNADPPSPASNNSLREELVDHAALERILQQSPVGTPISSRSIADDDESVDYASEKAPSPKKPIIKGRAGRLKTVGNPDLQEEQNSNSPFDPFVTEQHEPQTSDLPTIDFGPTLTYKPTVRPPTGGSTTPGSSLPHDADGAEQEAAPRSSSRLSMLDSRRNSYFEGRKVVDDEKRRSVAWQPATASPTDLAGPSLTPEQWVQYRATMASQTMPQSRPIPVYSHGRQQSSTNLARSTSKTPPPLSRTPSGDWSRQMRRTSKTPPLSRTPSGDWTQAANQVPSRPQSRSAGLYLSRTNSGDWTQPPSRPLSRSAGSYLNPPSPGKPLQSTLTSSLSAREQMHVARATGSPMIALPSKDKKREEQEQASGLIGALSARERERAAIKDGMRSGMVQQEIMRRQQQQAQMEMEARMQAQAQAQAQAQYQAQQQAQAYQLQLQQQQMANYMYGGNQYMGQMPQGQMNGGQSWGHGGIPQQQGYGGASYYSSGDPRQQQQHQQQQQQRRYQ